ncbi:YheC/YheD family protein [Pseudalkalibacillus decolorationis]|uniref:YheC/YheD family endospore coat-associated protein n=1 Tax=Pseudalkalibacillus decolorationis TaxID=163879 RepID=UPI002148F302|nr:YheC/YheD family protein [Pseudalkalibacillus decolorationis]
MERISAQLRSIHTSSSNPYQILLSTYLLEQLDIKEGQNIWLRLGSERIQVRCKHLFTIDEGSHIHLPSALGRSHCFPIKAGHYTFTYFPHLQELRLGIIIGLLTEKTPDHIQMFGNISDFSRELYLLCLEHQMTLYLFSLDDIEEDRIHGYTLDETGITKSTFPLPDVIYNRISSRSIERSEKYSQFFERCKDLGIAFFNDHFLSKWETLRILIELDTVAAYLPETHLYEGIESLVLIDKHPIVFLKPIHGREGKGIIRVQKTNTEQVQLDFSSKRNTMKSTVLQKTAIRFFEDLLPKETHIVQQGIPLLEYEGGKIDFRILCNRNDKGKWYISSSIARLSAQDRFVSNLSQGAKVYPSIEILERFFDKKKTHQLIQTMFEIAIDVSECISLHAGGIFGELGIDIGVDTKGHPWIIEINTKPSKQYLVESRTSGIRPSARGVFQFARFLAETSFHSSESLSSIN